MNKEEFIKSVKDFTDEYVSMYKDDKWEHYSDEAWGEIYDMGNVYHTDQVILKEKYSETRKLVADNEWFVNWIKKEFEQAKKLGVEIELHILGAVIQKEVGVNPDGPTMVNVGWIRYVKIKK